MKRAWLLLIILGIAQFGCGLTGEVSSVDEQRQVLPETIASGDAIAVVGIGFVMEDTLNCIDTGLRDRLFGVPVIAPHEFRDKLFPWFEPNIAPEDTESLSKLMLQSKVKQRIDDLHVRYVVTIKGQTSVLPESHWGGVFGGAPAGGVIIGGVDWEETTDLTAGILDMKQIRHVGQIRAVGKGVTAGGIIVLLPYAYSVSSLKAACKTIVERVVAYVTGKPQAPLQAEPRLE